MRVMSMETRATALFTRGTVLHFVVEKRLQFHWGLKAFPLFPGMAECTFDYTGRR
jgi:hypothetical protein